ncbi:MAG: tetratricopeptide repeat protein [Verrucomicrobiales bacterium]
MDSPTANLIHILRDRVDELVTAGNYDEAVHAATAAVEKAQQALTPELDNIDEFVDTLELRGDLFRSLGRYDDAEEDYRQALDQLENRADRTLQVARIAAAHGAAHDALGHPAKAAESWQRALTLFEQAEPPALLDVALMANNLAYLKKDEGDIDAAESHFLRALEIHHQNLGPDHEETATISNNLGALYHSAGYFEQAREMHLMALEARRKNFSDDHPDTAQSHNNLALALLETGDRSRARHHFESSLHAFQALGVDYHADLEAIASNYAFFLRTEGEAALADQVEKDVHALTQAARIKPA